MNKVLCVGPLSSGHIQCWIKDHSKEYEYVFFTIHPGELPESLKECKVYNANVTGTKLDFILAIFYLQFIVIKESPNLIYTSFFSSYGVLASLIFSRCKKILSVWGSDINLIVDSIGLKRLFYKRCLGNYSWINSPAKHLEYKIKSINKNVSVDVFQYGIKTDYLDSIISSSTHVKSSSVQFLSIRNWESLYNVTNVVAAFDLFSKKYPGHTLNIIGRGSLQKEIENLINGSNAKINIFGYLSHDILYDFISENDVVISIPSIDGTPLSLLESIYLGLTPMVSNIDANLEWLSPHNAIVVNPMSVQSIYEGFVEAVMDINKEKHCFKSLVKSKADYETNTKKLIDKFQEYI